MMITTEIVTIGGREFQETTSDVYMIRKVGADEVYSSAMDVLDAGFAYEETDVALKVDSEEEGVGNDPL